MENSTQCKFICEAKINSLQQSLIDLRSEFLKLEQKYWELRDTLKKLNYNNTKEI